MRVLVTGNNGQLLQCLRHLAPIHGLDLISIGRPEFDLLKPDTVMTAVLGKQPDLIVSAAAFTAVDKAEDLPGLAYATNAKGAGAVAAAASALNVPLIHISSDYVFSGSKPAPYTEADHTEPLSVYGASKLLGEAEVRAATANHVIIRAGWLYSPFGQNFLKTMLALAAKQDTVRVVADQRGRPTSALAAASAILALAHRLLQDDHPELRGVFHLAPAGDASWADFAEFIFGVVEAATARRIRIERVSSSEYPTAAMRPQNSCLDATKIKERYGITMPHWQTSARDIVEICLQLPAKETAQ